MCTTDRVHGFVAIVLQFKYLHVCCTLFDALFVTHYLEGTQSALCNKFWSWKDWYTIVLRELMWVVIGTHSRMEALSAMLGAELSSEAKRG